MRSKNTTRWSVIAAGIILFIIVPGMIATHYRRGPQPVSFAYPAAEVKRFSEGRFTRPAMPMWRRPISLFVSGDKDPRAGAFIAGMIYGMTRYVGVTLAEM
ncbi:hypothetical protein GCM10010994_52830 [Chelatococcus reniformis]|uniref:Uncharacterized protein n=1 Tax=Chelatococcus reniformis TaxID=1494448 RepID=A0A916UTX6_9HYPH|nr:hypothetical protein GCM10010994_52830 [Chelatococcus reniformis]